MFRQKGRVGYFDKIFQNKIGPQVSEFQIFVSTLCTLPGVVVVNAFVLKGLKSYITAVGCPDLLEGLERAGSDPQVGIMSLFVHSFERKMKITIAVCIFPLI